MPLVLVVQPEPELQNADVSLRARPAIHGSRIESGMTSRGIESGMTSRGIKSGMTCRGQELSPTELVADLQSISLWSIPCARAMHPGLSLG